MFTRQWIVWPYQKLIRAGIRRSLLLWSYAGSRVGQWHELQEGRRDRVEQVGANHALHSITAVRRSIGLQRILTGRKRREVPHRLSGSWRDQTRRCDDCGRPDLQTFIGTKDERSISNDRAAESCAKLVLLERCHECIEIILQVQRAVSEVIVCGAVKLVGAGTRDRIHNCTGEPTELRVEVTC